MSGILNLMGSCILETGKGLFRYDFHFTDNNEYDNIVYSVHSEEDINLDFETLKELSAISISQDIVEKVEGDNSQNKFTLLFIEKVICSEVIVLADEQRKESERIIEENVKDIRHMLGKK